jgi:hypothetical protein
VACKHGSYPETGFKEANRIVSDKPASANRLVETPWITGKREVTPQLPVKIDLPGYRLTYAARAAALGQLGECERAKDQLSQLIALRPDAAQSVRLELGKWYQPDLVEHWIEGLRKAGAGDSGS